MAKRVLFQVIIPVTFHPEVDKKPKVEVVSNDATTVKLEVTETVNDITSETTTKEVMHPPLILRAFLKKNGIHDSIEYPFVRKLFNSQVEVGKSGFLKDAEITEENSESKKVELAARDPAEKYITDESDSKIDENVKEMIKIQFTVKKESSEEYLDKLEALGIGQPNGFGSMHVVPIDISRRAMDQLEIDEIVDSEMQDKGISDVNPADSQNDDTKKNGFLDEIYEMRKEVTQTVKSRIAIDQIIQVISAGAGFSFDYVMLVLVASVIAAIGLITNSAVVIIASMLVSPLMGPVLAITFGITIHDFKLVKKGLKSELVALSVCFFLGLILGLAFGRLTYESNFNDVIEEWPGSEMQSRGTWKNLVSGLFVAFFSGIGVALSLLGSNTTSLVGVAISASLLPPVVNSGLLLGYGIVLPNFEDLSNETMKQSYPRQDDLFQMSGISFLLTVANIILIVVAGFGMFRLKEITPFQNKSDFWKTHLEEARKYNILAKGDGQNTDSLLNAVKDLYADDDTFIIGVNNAGYGGFLKGRAFKPKYQKNKKGAHSEFPWTEQTSNSHIVPDLEGDKNKLNQRRHMLKSLLSDIVESNRNMV